jgi:uncharacterized protein (DUF1499 family)
MTISRAALVLALVSLLLMPASGLAYRNGLLPLPVALLGGMGVAGLLGVSAVIVGLVASVRAVRSPQRPGLALAIAGIVCGLIAAAFPLSWMLTGSRVPPIHDITTDVDDPPGYAKVVALRAGAPNPLDYDPKVGEQQRAAYPDITPARLTMPPGEAFERALATARDQGWEIVSSDSQAGRIEATDTTFWFGFKDDVVIRLTPDGGGTRVDVRSVSRVGRSDIGTNARRIRAYLASLTSG